MYDVITINVERSGDFERNLKEYLDDGYELKKCSCGYHGGIQYLQSLDGNFSEENRLATK